MCRSQNDALLREAEALVVEVERLRDRLAADSDSDEGPAVEAAWRAEASAAAKEQTAFLGDFMAQRRDKVRSAPAAPAPCKRARA